MQCCSSRQQICPPLPQEGFVYQQQHQLDEAETHLNLSSPHDISPSFVCLVICNHSGHILKCVPLYLLKIIV